MPYGPMSTARLTQTPARIVAAKKATPPNEKAVSAAPQASVAAKPSDILTLSAANAVLSNENPPDTTGLLTNWLLSEGAAGAAKMREDKLKKYQPDEGLLSNFKRLIGM